MAGAGPRGASPVNRRPTLHLIKGGLAEKRHGIYRLRQRATDAPAVEIWPRDGEWRDLIQRLLGNPAKGP